MQKFDKLTGVAAPLNILNIDTDMIIPKRPVAGSAVQICTTLITAVLAMYVSKSR
jgi:3-isopropylmalate dehydratase small subunit